MLDYSWMDDIDANKPLLVISEVVFMYFPENDLKPLELEGIQKISSYRNGFRYNSSFSGKTF